MEELSERQIKILDVIIRTYMRTGEPVGSRTISKVEDMNLSSATIRNEMADLEEMGYIVQPHTSAGRIPTDMGYRFYVDRLMQEKDQEVSEMKEFVIERTEKMEQVLQNIAKLLATNTNYATLISAPQARHGKVKFIQLSAVDEEQVLATIVLDGNIVQSKIIHTDEALDSETMLRLNLLLNNSLNGLSLEEINLVTIARLKEAAGIHSEVVGRVLDAVAESVQETVQEGEDFEIYTSGTTNIFKYPELSDSQRASGLLEAFEAKEELRDLFAEGEEEPGTDIQVYIGSESPIASMKDCSVVTATYELGNGIHGMVGIVGPKRMDYDMVVDNLRTLKRQLDETFHPQEET